MAVAWLPDPSETEGKSGALSSMTVSATGQLIPTRSGVSDPDRADFSLVYVSPILGTSTTDSASTHGRQVAEDRNEPTCCQRRSSRLGLGRPKAGSLLLMNLYFF
jgi:hypothetical protein